MKTRFISYLSIIIFISIAAGCGSKKPVIIGYSGSITGTSSIIGSEVRNGLRLIIDQTNESGGINGRQIELIIKDDENSIGSAARVDRELINEGAKIIVGHITSQMTVDALSALKDMDIVMFSATASADSLLGIDDNFFRSILTGSQMAEQVSEFAVRKGVKNLGIIHDTRNEAFAEGWINTFTRIIKESGGIISKNLSFDSDNESEYKEIAAEMMESDPDAVLIIANAFSTALITRHIHNKNPDIMKFSSSWAFTNLEDLIAYGEDSVEGMISGQSFGLTSGQPAYIKFVDDYNSRYGKGPTHGSIYGYEAGLILVQGLKNASSLDYAGIKEGLKSVKISGLQGTIGLDENGDADRGVFVVSISGGRLEEIPGE